MMASAASETHAPAHQIWRGPRKMLTYRLLITVMLPGAGLKPPGGGLRPPTGPGLRPPTGPFLRPPGPFLRPPGPMGPASLLPGPCLIPPGPMLTCVLVLVLPTFTCAAPRAAPPRPAAPTARAILGLATLETLTSLLFPTTS